MPTDDEIENALRRLREAHAAVQAGQTERDSWKAFLDRNGIEFKFTVAGVSWKRRVPQTEAGA